MLSPVLVQASVDDKHSAVTVTNQSLLRSSDGFPGQLHKAQHMTSCMWVNIYSEFPFRGSWAQPLQLTTTRPCSVLTAADCWEKHVLCLWGLRQRQRAGPSLPSPGPSIQRDSAGARWKPLAMIYGMSSPGELVEPLPSCIWWGSNLLEG